MNDKPFLMSSSFRIVIALVTAFSFFILSCNDSFTEESNTTFTQPQPINTKTLLQFPDKIQGKYLSNNNSSFIDIGNNFILRIYEHWDKISNIEFDSTFVWSKDSVIEKSTDQKYFAIKEKDSVSIFTNDKDTVILLNASNALLKRFKEHYFLNQQLDDHNWSVKMLSFSKDKLVLNSLRDSVQFMYEVSIKDTAALHSDKKEKPLNLSKEDFKKYVNEDHFEERETFIRLSN